jgi:hypothetical protein
MRRSAGSGFWVSPRFAGALAALDIDPSTIFLHEAIKPWRTLPDRENCTLDLSPGALGADAMRLHVKRYRGARGRAMAAAEVRGLELLESAGIETTPLVAYGRTLRSGAFVITEDLAGFAAADRVINQGVPFDRLCSPTARLAARLHDAGLHHRDLYLCHFFARIDADGSVALRLIDAARVRRLPKWPTRQRWIVKDLAQFWFSTLALPVTAAQREAWLTEYGIARQVTSAEWQTAIERKAAWITRHDVALRRRQPNRNISIPI